MKLKGIKMNNLLQIALFITMAIAFGATLFYLFSIVQSDEYMKHQFEFNAIGALSILAFFCLVLMLYNAKQDFDLYQEARTSVVSSGRVIELQEEIIDDRNTLWRAYGAILIKEDRVGKTTLSDYDKTPGIVRCWLKNNEFSEPHSRFLKCEIVG